MRHLAFFVQTLYHNNIDVPRTHGGPHCECAVSNDLQQLKGISNSFLTLYYGRDNELKVRKYSVPYTEHNSVVKCVR